MATTQNQRERLALAGFVRVDGLTAFHGGVGEKIHARIGEAGCWGMNNGKVSFITTDEEIWLGSSMIHGNIVFDLAGELSNCGRGCFVPCSNGEGLRDADLLRRLANPDWMPD